MSGERREAGFSLIEMLVATVILSTGFLVLVQLTATGQRIARTQPDAADLHQRLRAAVDLMQRDLLMAGAGFSQGAGGGPLVNYLPPLMPMRTGAVKPDPALSFFTDRVTLVYVPEASATTTLLADMASPGLEVPIDPSGPGCPAAGLCGFEEGSRALIVSTAGTGDGFELFSVTSAAGGLGHGPPNPVFGRAYRATAARVALVRQRTYYLDAATQRLMMYDGYKTDVPLADNIVLLRFDYFVDPSPRAAPRPAAGDGTCVYAADMPPRPLLAELGTTVLAPAGAALLTDGPICGVGANRFDGDLLRIRRIRVTLRAQVSDRGLRGAGADFLRGGTSQHGERYVPDIEVSVDVTPRNLIPTR